MSHRWRPFPPGEDNPKAKLTAPQVETIKTLREAGYTIRRLASDYGVSPSTIHDVIKRRSFRK